MLERWNRLTNLISGVFCGSINLITDKNTLLPLLEHEGSDRSVVTLKGQLPGEAVCTQNLTPWTKLLPCSFHVPPSTCIVSRVNFAKGWTVDSFKSSQNL